MPKTSRCTFKISFAAFGTINCFRYDFWDNNVLRSSSELWSVKRPACAMILSLLSHGCKASTVGKGGSPQCGQPGCFTPNDMDAIALTIGSLIDTNPSCASLGSSGLECSRFSFLGTCWNWPHYGGFVGDLHFFRVEICLNCVFSQCS